MRILELCKILGIETFEGLQRFEKDEVQSGETLEQALVRYLAGLGAGWCLRNDI